MDLAVWQGACLPYNELDEQRKSTPQLKPSTLAHNWLYGSKLSATKFSGLHVSLSVNLKMYRVPHGDSRGKNVATPGTT